MTEKRTRTRKYAAILIAATLAAMLSGCASENDIPVSSISYKLPEKLAAGKFDGDYAEKMDKTTYSYSDRNIYISVRNDALFVSGTDSSGDGVKSLTVPGGCFTGTAGSGSTAGSLIFRTDGGTTIPIVNESCRGIFPFGTGCIAVTFMPGNSESAGASGSVYMLTPAADLTWSRQLVASLDGVPDAACLAADGSAVLVAVSGEKKSLVKMSADGKMSTLTGSELFQKFTVSSLVEWRGSIYCASKTGILAFDPTNEKETWYPIDWRKLDN